MFTPEVHPVVNSGVLLPPASQHVPHLLSGHAQVEAGGAVAHDGGGAVAQRGVRRARTASDRAAATAKNLERSFQHQPNMVRLVYKPDFVQSDWVNYCVALPLLAIAADQGRGDRVRF